MASITLSDLILAVTQEGTLTTLGSTMIWNLHSSKDYKEWGMAHIVQHNINRTNLREFLERIALNYKAEANRVLARTRNRQINYKPHQNRQ